MLRFKKIKNAISSILIYGFIVLMLVIGIPGSIVTMGMITKGLLGHAEIGIYGWGLLIMLMVVWNIADRMDRGASFWKALFTPDPDKDYDPYDWDRINFDAYY